MMQKSALHCCHFYRHVLAWPQLLRTIQSYALSGYPERGREAMGGNYSTVTSKMLA